MNDMSAGTAHPLTEKYHLFIASKDLALSVYLIYQGKFMKQQTNEDSITPEMKNSLMNSNELNDFFFSTE